MPTAHIIPDPEQRVLDFVEAATVEGRSELGEIYADNSNEILYLQLDDVRDNLRELAYYRAYAEVLEATIAVTGVSASAVRSILATAHRTATREVTR
jgi:hypothetical protein